LLNKQTTTKDKSRKEALAIKLRSGNASANTTSDHIEVLSAAIAAIPGRYRRRILVTTDGAGASIDLCIYRKMS
jgi:hypothetical protein